MQERLSLEKRGKKRKREVELEKIEGKGERE
jgi:hypothetical protein